MRPRRLTTATAAAVTTAALLAAGCGGSDNPTPTDWANGLCGAITTWSDSLKQTVNDAKSSGLSKDSLSTAVDEAKASTQEFTDTLDGLGKPNTDAGAQAQDAVDTLSSEIQADITTIQEAVQSASGLTGVVNAAKVIQDTIQKATTQITDTVTGFQNIDAKGELEQGFKDAPACKSLPIGS